MGERPYLMDYRKTEDLISHRLVMPKHLKTSPESASETISALTSQTVAFRRAHGFK